MGRMRGTSVFTGRERLWHTLRADSGACSKGSWIAQAVNEEHALLLEVGFGGTRLFLPHS